MYSAARMVVLHWLVSALRRRRFKLLGAVSVPAIAAATRSAPIEAPLLSHMIREGGTRL